MTRQVQMFEGCEHRFNRYKPGLATKSQRLRILTRRFARARNRNLVVLNFRLPEIAIDIANK